MKSSFLVQVLALEADRISDPGFARGVANDFTGMAPSLVLRAPGDAAFVVSQFLRRAQVINLVERDLFLAKAGSGRCFGVAVPERIEVDVIPVVGAHQVLGRDAGRQRDRRLPRRLRQRYEAAGFMDVMDAASVA